MTHSLQLGLDGRAGIHTGEIERPAGHPPRGIAVYLGARVANIANAGEVIVSSTTHDLVAGSDITFNDLGNHRLKGFPQPHRLYQAFL